MLQAKLSSSFPVAFVLSVAVALAASAHAAEPAAAAPQSGGAAQAIDEAKRAVAATDAVGGLWRDTEKMLAAAEAAAKAGDEAKAATLAREAKTEAELGYNQVFIEKSAYLIGKAREHKALSAEQKRALAVGEELYLQQRGTKAYEQLKVFEKLEG